MPFYLGILDWFVYILQESGICSILNIFRTTIEVLLGLLMWNCNCVYSLCNKVQVLGRYCIFPSLILQILILNYLRVDFQLIFVPPKKRNSSALRVSVPYQMDFTNSKAFTYLFNFDVKIQKTSASVKIQIWAPHSQEIDSDWRNLH